MKVKDVGEIALIRRITKDIKLDRSVVKGAGDDTAVMAWTAKKYLLYTCDMLVEGVHFTTGAKGAATPFQIGWKALGRNISDIAAMGGVPRYAVVSMALPPDTRVSFVDGVYNGMKDLASRFGVNIVGGDVSRSGKIVIDVSLTGEVEKENLVLRSGARRGDAILVTGSIGGSIRRKHLEFMPRVDAARHLVKRFKLHAMIDVSDGLLLDLWRILDASNAGARIYRSAVPLSSDAGPFDRAVRDGEDFELLFTIGMEEAIRIRPVDVGFPIAVIGEITDKRCGYRLIRDDGRAQKIAPHPDAKGFLHF